MNKSSMKTAALMVWKLYMQHKRIVAAVLLLLLIIMGGNMLLPGLTAKVIDDGLVSGNRKELLHLSIWIFLINTSIAALYMIVEHFRLKGYNSVIYILRERSLKKLMNVEFDFFSGRTPSDIYSQLSDDIDSIAGCFSTELFIAFSQIFIVFGLVPILCLISWKLTLLTFTFIPLKIIKTMLLSRKSYKNARNMIDAKKEYSKWLGETVSAVSLIRFFGVQGVFRRMYKEKQQYVMQTQYRHEMLQEINIQTESVATNLIEVLCYILAGYLIAGNNLTIGEFVSFELYSVHLFGLFSQFIGIYMQLSGVLPSFERFRDFLSLPEEPDGGAEINIQNYDINMDQVSFSYPNGVKVLERFSMHIPEGMHLAVTGENGAGKSTILQLILRMYSFDSGSITLGGQQIEQIDLGSYRKLFSVVPQKPFFFCDSIKNNLTLFRELPEEKLEWIAENVGITELIRQKGWDYCVGQDGCELSGGQRQLIGLGRILAEERPIVILDEAENNIDEKYTAIMQGLLEGCFRDKTVIFITHKKEMLRFANEVIRIGSENQEENEL